jgi:hypothetical protein
MHASKRRARLQRTVVKPAPKTILPRVVHQAAAACKRDAKAAAVRYVLPLIRRLPGQNKYVVRRVSAEPKAELQAPKAVVQLTAEQVRRKQDVEVQALNAVHKENLVELNKAFSDFTKSAEIRCPSVVVKGAGSTFCDGEYYTQGKINGAPRYRKPHSSLCVYKGLQEYWFVGDLGVSLLPNGATTVNFYMCANYDRRSDAPPVGLHAWHCSDQGRISGPTCEKGRGTGEEKAKVRRARDQVTEDTHAEVQRHADEVAAVIATSKTRAERQTAQLLDAQEEAEAAAEELRWACSLALSGQCFFNASSLTVC